MGYSPIPVHSPPIHRFLVNLNLMGARLSKEDEDKKKIIKQLNPNIDRFHPRFYTDKENILTHCDSRFSLISNELTGETQVLWKEKDPTWIVAFEILIEKIKKARFHLRPLFTHHDYATNVYHVGFEKVTEEMESILQKRIASKSPFDKYESWRLLETLYNGVIEASALSLNKGKIFEKKLQISICNLILDKEKNTRIVDPLFLERGNFSDVFLQRTLSPELYETFQELGI